MKKKNLFLALGLVTLFTACANEDDSSMENNLMNQPVTKSLDLGTLDYTKMSGILNNMDSNEKTVTLKDGDNTRNVCLSKVRNVTISGLSDATLFRGRDNDSISLALASNYATISMVHNGQLIRYVAYKDKKEMERIANYYSTQYLPTRSVSMDGILTYINGTQSRSGEVNISCLKLNITNAIKKNPKKLSMEGDYPNHKRKLADNTSSHAATRNWDTNPVMLEFILLNEENGGNIEHEVTWQIESLVASIKFLTDQDLAQYYFSIYDAPFEANCGEYDVANCFFNFLTGWDKFAGQGDKIFILMRNGTWGNTLGRVFAIGAINVNAPLNSFEMSAVSTTSSLYPHTIAHEVGHLLGAEHVDDTTDLMYNASTTDNSGLHQDANNIATMTSALTLKP